MALLNIRNRINRMEKIHRLMIIALVLLIVHVERNNKLLAIVVVAPAIITKTNSRVLQGCF